MSIQQVVLLFVEDTATRTLNKIVFKIKSLALSAWSLCTPGVNTDICCKGKGMRITAPCTRHVKKPEWFFRHLIASY
jgi:hypothetical protein